MVGALSDNVMFGQLRPRPGNPAPGMVTDYYQNRVMRIAVGNALVDPLCGLVPLQIINPENDNVEITSGTKLAEFVMISCVLGERIPIARTPALGAHASHSGSVATCPEELYEAVDQLSDELTLEQQRSIVLLLVEFTEIITCRGPTPG